MEYYCHCCAVALGKINPLSSDTLNLTGSLYQFDKFIKHTAPINTEGFISIYDDPSFDKYKEYSVTASLSGCVEIDECNRANVIWYAGENIGVSKQNGIYECDADTVKLVLQENADKVHSFPVLSGDYMKTLYCSKCGCEIID